VSEEFCLLLHSSSPYEDNIKRACSWLVQHQLTDGGWGENFEACEQKEYVVADKSQVVNTAWALLGLMAVR
jgi:lanosterol synthase